VPVLLLAAAVRVVAWQQVRDSPMLELHHWSETDMALYFGWARAIRAGDWLSRLDTLPYHSWHQHIARDVHAASGSMQPFDEQVARRIWRGWLGEHEFYEDPLYPYFLAGVTAVFGERVGAVYFVQSLFGLATVALVVLIARGMFDDVVAAVAGAMAALFGPLVFFESLLLRSVLNAFTGLLTVAWTMRVLRAGPRGRRVLALGVICGVSFLVQATAIVFTLAAAVLLAVRFRRPLPQALVALAWMAAGFVVGVSPLVARNVAVGARPFGPPAHGPVTFINQNAADVDAGGGAYYSRYAPSIMAATGGRFWPVAVATIETHASAWSWVRLCGRKLYAFWRWYEVPNNANYYYFCLYARAACAVAVTFTVIGPLGAIGLLLSLRRGWVTLPAIVYVATGLLTTVLFTTLSRLRLPYACALIPFAAFTAVWIVRAVKGHRMVAAVAVAIAVALAAVAFARPLGVSRTPIWATDYGVGNEIVSALAEREATAGDLAAAIRRVERQLEATEPEALRSLQPGTAPSRIPVLDAEVSGSFAALHGLAARLHAAAQDQARAQEHALRARVLQVVAAQWQSASGSPPRARPR